MNITYDKAYKQRVWQVINNRLYNDMCPFCGTVITAKNFAGAAWIDEEFRAFDSNIICLLQFSDNIRELENESTVS